MKLSDLFEYIVYGELSQLDISGTGDGVDPADYPKMTAAINLGLTALHTRFPIREEEVLIQQNDGITVYFLRYLYAASNSVSVEPVKYISDLGGAPFQENVLQIQEVFNEIGEEIPLNDEHDSTSIWTPGFDSLQIPEPNSANSIAVIYRANHDKLLVDAATDITGIDVNIPASLVEALSAFVAGRFISPMGKDGVAAGNNLFVKYETLLRQVEMQGIFNLDQHKRDNITENGWV